MDTQTPAQRFEKLIKLHNLLQRYEWTQHKRGNDSNYSWRIEGEDIIGENLILGGDEQIDTGYLIICSKRYGFIQRLYKKDLINREDIPTGFDYTYINSDPKDIYCVSYGPHILIMWLAIQMEPIEYLLKYIK